MKLRATVRSLGKRAVVGTPLEPPICWLIAASHGREELLNYRYDRETLAVMRRVLRRDSVCVDVGANVGSILDQMFALAPEGLHFAVEPIPGLAEGLRKKYAGRDNVIVVQSALGAVSGREPFCLVPDNPGLSGMLRTDCVPPQCKVGMIDVTVRRLDDVVEDATVDFIKIDVEGAELRVFAGASQTLGRCRPVVVFEHGLGAADVYDARPSRKLFDLVVGEYGMRISLMKDWLRGRAPLSAAEFDERFQRHCGVYYIAHY